MNPVHDYTLRPEIGVPAVKTYPYEIGLCRIEAILADINLQSGSGFKVKGSVFPLADIAVRYPVP
jgi:hypothetical protein